MTVKRRPSRVRGLVRPLHDAARRPLGWLARQEGIVLLTAFAIVLAVYGFIELSEEIHEGEMRHFDEWVLRLVRRTDDPALLIGPRWVAEAVTDFTALGGTAILTTVLICAVGYLALLHRYGAAAFVPSAAAGGGLLSDGSEAALRARPAVVVPHLVMVEGLSFPSGHSMAAAVIYLTLGALMARFAARRRIRVYVIAISFGLTCPHRHHAGVSGRPLPDRRPGGLGRGARLGAPLLARRPVPAVPRRGGVSGASSPR